jgi:hypothetical protein
MMYVCYNVPFDFPEGILFFNTGSDIGPAEETMGSIDFSTIGESTIADPSNIPCAFASSIVESEGFKTAGATVGLLPEDGLLDVSVFFILAAL